MEGGLSTCKLTDGGGGGGGGGLSTYMLTDGGGGLSTCMLTDGGGGGGGGGEVSVHTS